MSIGEPLPLSPAGVADLAPRALAPDLDRRVAVIQSDTASHLAVELGALSLVREFSDSIEHFATSVTDAAEAEDIAQEVLSRAWLAIKEGKFQPGKPLRPWLIGITRHRAIMAHRRQRARPDTVSVGVNGGSFETIITANSPNRVAGPLEYVLEQEAAQEQLASLAQLNPDQDAALLLTALDYTQVEIAHIQGVPLGTVKGRVRLGREAVKEQFAQPDEPEIIKEAA